MRVSAATPLGGMPGTRNCVSTAAAAASASTQTANGVPSGSSLPIASRHCSASFAVSPLAPRLRQDAPIAPTMALASAFLCFRAAAGDRRSSAVCRGRARWRAASSPSARTNSPRAPGLSASALARAAISGRSAAARLGWRSNAAWKNGPFRRHRLFALNAFSAPAYAATAASPPSAPRRVHPRPARSRPSRARVAPAPPAREAGTATPRWRASRSPLFSPPPEGRDAARMEAAEGGGDGLDGHGLAPAPAGRRARGTRA